jgi:tetratricopeptide (TPR) repeat protein
MRIIFISLLIVVLPLSLFGQTSEFKVREMVKTASEQELVIACSQMMQENYLFHAEIVADKLLTLKPQSSNYNYRKGYIELSARQDFESAMTHLKIAILNTDKNYDMFSHKEESAAVDAFYHLARCYHLNEEIVKAREYYQIFIDESDRKSELVKKSEVGLILCDVAE